MGKRVRLRPGRHGTAASAAAFDTKKPEPATERQFGACSKHGAVLRFGGFSRDTEPAPRDMQLIRCGFLPSGLYRRRRNHTGSALPFLQNSRTLTAGRESRRALTLPRKPIKEYQLIGLPSSSF